MIEKLVRKEILKVHPYVPGKPIETLKRELGIKGRIIKLASNENSLGPSPKAVAAARRAAADVHLYPEGSSFLLRQEIAKRLGVSGGEVIFGSGTDEIIEQLGKTFIRPEDEIVVSEHAFVRYRDAGDIMGCRVISVPMIDYAHDLTAMAAAASTRTKIIFIANPNNPTGTYNGKEELSAFLERLKVRFGGYAPIVVLDEAYYEYARGNSGYPESIDYFKGGRRAAKYPNLVILRTFSKAYGLAGLRVGYAVADRDIVQFLDRARLPFNLTSVSQAAALAALGDAAHIRKSVKIVDEGKKFLYWELKKAGIKYVPSAANFILLDVSPLAGQTVFEMLLRKGVIVRAMDEYGFPNHLRVTISTQQENKIFLEKLKIALKELGRDTTLGATEKRGQVQF
jgi:histidinol-phosphate aminotransferase